MKPANPPHPLQAMLEAKRRSQRLHQAGKAANPLTDKMARWQRFNRFGWDKKQG